MGRILASFFRRTSLSYLEDLRAQRLKLQNRQTLVQSQMTMFKKQTDQAQTTAINCLKFEAQQAKQALYDEIVAGVIPQDQANPTETESKAYSSAWNLYQQKAAEIDMNLSMRTQMVQNYYKQLEENQYEPLVQEDKAIALEIARLEDAIKVEEQNNKAAEEWYKSSVQEKPMFVSGG